MNDDDPLFGNDDEAERPRIKVTDRRSFDREGNPRPAQRAAEEGASASDPPREPKAAAAGEQPPATDAAEGAPQEDAAPEGATAAAAEDRYRDPSGGEKDGGDDARDASRIATPEPSAADLPRDFAALVESMYLEAMLYLGAIADPRTGQTMEDVELGKYKIDLLGMLQEKTAGNLEAEEARYLEEAVYQLRMVYLQKTKAAKI